MKSKTFNLPKLEVYNVTKSALKSIGCEKITGNFETGIIEARMGGNILSFGNEISIKINQLKNGKTKVIIISESIGVQLIDWGTNDNNEIEILDILTEQLK